MNVATAETPVNYRDIEGFPGYRVGDDGSVWSCRENYRIPGRKGHACRLSDNWHRLSPILTRRYYVVNLMRDGKANTKRIHTLVLNAFVGPCPAGMEACHGPGGKLDNRLSNLRWDTHAENNRDRIRHGTMHWKLNADIIREMRALHAAGMSRIKIAAKFNVDHARVSRIISGKIWSHVK